MGKIDNFHFRNSWEEIWMSAVTLLIITAILLALLIGVLRRGLTTSDQ